MSSGDTRGADYTRRLQRRGWKRFVDVQAPYRWNLRRHDLGRTLDIGCGVGRNLATLPEGSVGVDHNATSVAVARERGLTAFTSDEFRAEDWDPFDAFLVAHVVEHMTPSEAVTLLRDYLPALRGGGRVLLICPQERGYASDPTHVQWTAEVDLQWLAREVGLEPQQTRSFPFPRRAGRWFTYNEFNLLAVKP